DESALGVAKVDVQLAPARRRIGLGHVLLQNFERRGALHEHRAQVANERRQNVAPLERVRTADRVRFLSQRPKESADDFRLPIQGDQPLLERARQAHPVVQLEQRWAMGDGRWSGFRLGDAVVGAGHMWQKLVGAALRAYYAQRPSPNAQLSNSPST